MITALALYLSPTIAAALLLFAFARWTFTTAEDRESAKTFTLDFIPFTSDVRAAEKALPEMRNAA